MSVELLNISTVVSLQKVNSTTFVRQGDITELTISPGSSSTSSNNMIAYYPNYTDAHRSSLATLFVNLEALYPCVDSHNDISCKLFPYEDDGFRGGRAILESSDDGGNFEIFGQRIATYAFALDGCAQLDSNCYSTPSQFSMDLLLVCLLPRSQCT